MKTIKVIFSFITHALKKLNKGSAHKESRKYDKRGESEWDKTCLPTLFANHAIYESVEFNAFEQCFHGENEEDHGKNGRKEIAIHANFFKFILAMFPEFARRRFDFTASPEDLKIKTTPTYQHKKKRIRPLISIEDKNGIPLLVLESEMIDGFDSEHFKKASKLLNRKFPDKKIQKVLFSFTDKTMPDYLTVNLKDVLHELQFIFNREFRMIQHHDSIYIIHYVNYIKTFVGKINSLENERRIFQAIFGKKYNDLPSYIKNKEILKVYDRLKPYKGLERAASKINGLTYRQAVRDAVDSIFRKRRKIVRKEMRWDSCFSAYIKNNINAMIIPENDFMSTCEYVPPPSTLNNPITKRYIDIMKDPWIPKESYWYKFRQHSSVMPNKLLYALTRDDEQVDHEVSLHRTDVNVTGLFPPFKDVMMKVKESVGGDNESDELRNAIVAFYRTLANFAVIQLNVNREKTEFLNAVKDFENTFRESSVSSSLRTIKKINDILIREQSLTSEINIPFPSLLNLKIDSGNTIKLKKAAESGDKFKPKEVISTYHIFEDEINAFPFLRYPLIDRNQVIETPIGAFSLTSVYKVKVGNYINTDCIHSISHIRQARPDNEIYHLILKEK